MKNLTKKMSFNFLLIFMAVYTINVKAGSSAINHTFNYQGQLMDNGSPANGNYDITVSAYFSAVDGLVQGQSSEHLNVVVSNGLFTLNNVDIVDPGGVNPFDGFDLFLEVAVKPAGAGSYTALSPRQSLQSVPYANNMTPKSALNGQVLTYDSSTGQWEPTTPSSTWTVTGLNVSYTDGRVGIGVDIGSSAFGAKLVIQGEEPFAQSLIVNTSDGTARLLVGTGVTIGPGSVLNTPANGLAISGDSKQSGSSDGMLKYLVKATCSAATQAVDSFFNGTTGSGSASIAAFDINPGSCDVVFPSGSGNITDLNNRYWVATAIAPSNTIVTCERNASHTLRCRRTTSSSGSASGGQFMILVY